MQIDVLVSDQRSLKVIKIAIEIFTVFNYHTRYRINMHEIIGCPKCKHTASNMREIDWRVQLITFDRLLIESLWYLTFEF